MAGIRVELEPKLEEEVKSYYFYFSLPTGVTISSAECTVTVYSGVDASPSSLLNGAESISGATVTQKIEGGEEGVIYNLQCEAVFSDGQHVCQGGYLAVLPVS